MFVACGLAPRPSRSTLSRKRWNREFNYSPVLNSWFFSIFPTFPNLLPISGFSVVYPINDSGVLRKLPANRGIPMSQIFSRREALQVGAAGCLVTALGSPASANLKSRRRELGGSGLVSGKMTGAQALVETLLQEGVDCVYGIPGAQNNELWDTMKSKGLSYLLVTHEFSAAAMAFERSDMPYCFATV